MPPKSRNLLVKGENRPASSRLARNNYRAACRGKSTADVIAKLAIVEEEADESIFWLELIGEAGLLPNNRLTDLIDEFNQIVAMIVASQKTLRLNNPKSKIDQWQFQIVNASAKGSNCARRAWDRSWCGS